MTDCDATGASGIAEAVFRLVAGHAQKVLAPPLFSGRSAYNYYRFRAGGLRPVTRRDWHCGFQTWYFSSYSIQISIRNIFGIGR